MTFENPRRRRSSEKNLPDTSVADQIVASESSVEEEILQTAEGSSLIKTPEKKTPDNTTKDDVIQQIEKALTENPSQFSVSVVDASPKKKGFLEKRIIK